MSNQWSTMNGRTSKRGLFVGGVWHCDCQPRLPAERFQVKNGGKNHGRRFYTCQKPQPKRCPFFLWADDAKVREEGAVLSNSRNEPSAQNLPQELPAKAPETPRTPMRQTKIYPITPTTKLETSAISTKSKAESPKSHDHDDTYDWSSSADEDLAEVADIVESGSKTHSFGKASPRKATNISELASPSKRKHSDISQGTLVGESDGEPWSPDNDEVFLTPSTSNISFLNDAGAHSPPPKTPVAVRRQLFSQSEPRPEDSRTTHPDTTASPLALDALTILSPVNSFLSPAIKNDLVGLLNRQDLRTQGITKGREIARLAVKAKEGKIVELQQRIAALEAEKETSRVVIQHLKTDIANSPKKLRRSRGEEVRRSAV